MCGITFLSLELRQGGGLYVLPVDYGFLITVLFAALLVGVVVIDTMEDFGIKAAYWFMSLL